MLEVDDICAAVGHKTLFSHLSFRVSEGESWAIIGPNGSGKSTLLSLVSGLRKPAEGSVRIHDEPIIQMSQKELAVRVGLLPQFEELNFWGNVSEYVRLGRFAHASTAWSVEDDDVVFDALSQVDMKSMSHRLYRSLSGGERQRARLASLIAQTPELFLWDEPLENLDYRAQAIFLSWVNRVIETKNHASMMVIHDINVVSHFFTHVLMIFRDGTIELGEKNEMLTIENLNRLYQTSFRRIEDQGQALFTPG